VCYGVHNFHYILTVFNFVDITSKFPAVFLSATCRTGIVEMFVMCLRNLDLNMCFVGPLFCSFTFYQKKKKNPYQSLMFLIQHFRPVCCVVLMSL